jgi:hypothetical protein
VVIKDQVQMFILKSLKTGLDPESCALVIKISLMIQNEVQCLRFVWANFTRERLENFRFLVEILPCPVLLTHQNHPFLDLTHIMSLLLPQLPLLAPQPNHSPSVSLHPLTPTLVQQNPWIPQVLIHSTLRWLLERLLHTCH